MLRFVKILSVLFFISCSGRVPDSGLSDTFLRKYNESMTSADKINLANEMFDIYGNSDKKNELSQLFISAAYSTKDEVFSGYLFYLISDIYLRSDAKYLALYYMLKVDESVYDLDVEGYKLGYLLGLKCLKIDGYPEVKKEFYKKLINRYPDMVDMAQLYFDLAELYKNQYEMNLALNYYERLLDMYSKGKIEDDRFNLSRIRENVGFYKNSKTWIYKDLNELIDKIKYAIDSRNQDLLYQYVPNSGFKVCFFKSSDNRNWTLRELGIARWWGRQISFSSKVEEFSNENEIYIETTNWSFPQLHSWYFYFKKIDYPYDDNINGGWEWKGIYFGNWL